MRELVFACEFVLQYCASISVKEPVRSRHLLDKGPNRRAGTGTCVFCIKDKTGFNEENTSIKAENQTLGEMKLRL